MAEELATVAIPSLQLIFQEQDVCNFTGSCFGGVDELILRKLKDEFKFVNMEDKVIHDEAPLEV